jgi:pantothenate kinase
VTAIADDLRALLADTTGRLIVGITGPPGAGKSTVARALVEDFGPTAAYLPMDGFHLSNVQLERLGRRDRKGAPDTFDVDGYVATLQRVAAAYDDHDVYVPEFDRAIEESIAAGLVVTRDVRLAVTEGNYLGYWPAVHAVLDRLYYVDVPADIRRQRLIARHVDGGRTPAEAEAWIDSVDEPNARLIAATRGSCDGSFQAGS